MNKIQSAFLAILSFCLLASTIACGDVGDPSAIVPSAMVAELAQQDRCFLDAEGQLNSDCLPARTEADWQVFAQSKDKTRVRSMRAWNRCLRRVRCNPLKRLKKLQPELIEQFTESLVFRKGALAGADYSMIVDELSYREFTNLWDKFGMSGPVLSDHQDYACVGPGDCEKDSDHICTSNC